MATTRVPEPRAAFVPAPAGTHNAVCVDAIDLFDVERSYGGKSWKEDQVRFVFQIERRIAAADVNASIVGLTDPAMIADRKKLIGQRFSVRTFGQKVSMDPKAGLRKLVEAWTGRAWGIGEQFDSEKFVGMPCFLTVVHKKGGEDGSKIYANIGGIAPVMKDEATGQPLRPVLAPDNYTRAAQAVPEGNPHATSPFEGEDADLPPFAPVSDEDVPDFGQ